MDDVTFGRSRMAISGRFALNLLPLRALQNTGAESDVYECVVSTATIKTSVVYNIRAQYIHKTNRLM